MRKVGSLLFALALAGCTAFEAEPELQCTLMGCDDEVTLKLGSAQELYADVMPITFGVCLAEVCRWWTFDARDSKWCTLVAKEDYGWPASCSVHQGEMEMRVPLVNRQQGELPVTLTIHSNDGTVLFEGQNTPTIEARYPNGYECDKDWPCYSGSADFRHR